MKVRTYTGIKILLLPLLAVVLPFIAKTQDTTLCVLHTTPGTGTILVDVYDSAFAEPPVTGTDDLSATVDVQKTGEADITKLGSYTITYTGTDDAGNTCTYVRVIKVVDRIKPVVICQPVTITRWTAFDPIEGISTIDNYNAPADFTNATNGCHIQIVSNNFNPNAEGIYHVCYIAIDQSGNISDTCCNMISMVTSCPGIGFEKTTFDIYPNPAKGKFDILLNHEAEDITVKIINIAGQTIQTFIADDVVNGKISADLSGEAAGIYFIEVSNAGLTGIKKLILSK